MKGTIVLIIGILTIISGVLCINSPNTLYAILTMIAGMFAMSLGSQSWGRKKPSIGFIGVMAAMLGFLAAAIGLFMSVF